MLLEDQARAKWGQDVPFGGAEQARSHPTFVAGDSGLVIYRNTKKSLPTTDFSVFTDWKSLSTSIGSGYTRRFPRGKHGVADQGGEAGPSKTGSRLRSAASSSTTSTGRWRRKASTTCVSTTTCSPSC